MSITTQYRPPPPLLPLGIRPAHSNASNPSPPPDARTSASIPLVPGVATDKPMTSAATTSDASQSTPPPSTSPAEATEPMDKASLIGQFGWLTLDSVNIPCLFRHKEQFVSVRMVEQKLLSKYPSTYPDELRQRAPLVSQFITPTEAKLLNEINIEHCACEFGQQAFTDKDLVVSWKDFGEFHKIVKKHFPSDLKVTKPHRPIESAPVAAPEGGWVQINNTVVPYIRRLAIKAKETLRLAPLPVIKYAAGLLTDTPIPTLHSNDDECEKLTDMCCSAGLDFTFASTNTPLVLLTMLPVYSDVTVTMKRLPDDDPFSGAEFSEQFESEDSTNGRNASGGAMLPTTPNIPKPTQRYVSDMDKIPPPNVTIQRSDPSTLSSAGIPRPPVSYRHIAPAGSAPPAKRPRTAAPATTATVPLVPSATPVRGFAQSPFIPANFVMPPPGMVHGAEGAWRPRADNPADMKKLAEMMNMQAAILSQTGAMSVRNRLIHAGAVNQTDKTNCQVVPGSQAKAHNAPSSQSQSNKSRTANVEPSVKIKPIDFHGKKVSCLVKEGSKQQFALIEAVSRVYFPKCRLDEFLDAVSKVLQISVYQLNKDEEKAFIKFYGLPTESLKCNKVVNLKDLDQQMPRMKYMFADKMSTNPHKPGLGKPNVKPKQATSPPPVSQSASLLPSDPQTDAKVSDGQTSPLNFRVEQPAKPEESQNDAVKPEPIIEGAKSSVAPPSSDESNNNKPSAAAGSMPAKKPPVKSRAGGLSKLSKLEDAVNRLHKNKLKELTNSSPTHSPDGRQVSPVTVAPPAATSDTNDIEQGPVTVASTGTDS